MPEIVVQNTGKYPSGKPKLFCPIRFTRFRQRFIFSQVIRDWPILHGNPPVDNHGNKAFGTAAARGPVLGFGFPAAVAPADRTFRVQLMRDCLSEKALLFPVLRDASVVSLVAPTSGGSLPRPPAGASYSTDDDVIEMQANAVTAIHQTVLDIHYQSTTGPLLGSVTLFIYPAIAIPVQIYAVTIDHLVAPIHHGPPRITPATVRSYFERVNHYYEQTGINFTCQTIWGLLEPIMVHAGLMLCRRDRRRNPPGSGCGDPVNYLRTFADAGWYRQYASPPPTPPLPLPPRQAPLSLTSATFSPDFGTMPQRCSNTAPTPNNVSPHFQWAGLPQGTLSLAILCEDANAGNAVHWSCFDIPANIFFVSEGLNPSPPNCRQGTNDFGSQGYTGPFPPAGQVHEYKFTLFALDVATLGLAAGATSAQVRPALSQHVIDYARYSGTYP